MLSDARSKDLSLAPGRLPEKSSLFQAPVVLLDLSTCLGKFQPHQFIHLQIVGGAVTLGLFTPAKDS